MVQQVTETSDLCSHPDIFPESRAEGGEGEDLKLIHSFLNCLVLALPPAVRAVTVRNTLNTLLSPRSLHSVIDKPR